MNEIVIKEKCDISIPEINLIIRYDGDKVQLALTGNTDLVVDGDFHICTTGELGLISKSGIHIDSIDSNINLNSRIGKVLKDLPESIEYRRNIESDRLKSLGIPHESSGSLEDRVQELEDKIEFLMGVE